MKDQGAAGLVLISRSADKGETVCQELSTDGCTCVFVKADLSSAEDASGVIDKASTAITESSCPTKTITGLVNAAATTSRGNLLTTTADDFDWQMALNVRAPFLVSQGFAKYLINMNDSNDGSAAVGGSIVNICSVAAKGGAPFIMAYSAAKAALVCMTKNNATEMARYGIRVNGVNMGWCLTDNENALQTKTNGPNWAQEADAGVPIGRILRPRDVAATVGFLLSSASNMMTGSIIDLHPEYADGMLSLVADEATGR